MRSKVAESDAISTIVIGGSDAADGSGSAERYAPLIPSKYSAGGDSVLARISDDTAHLLVVSDTVFEICSFGLACDHGYHR